MADLLGCLFGAWTTGYSRHVPRIQSNPAGWPPLHSHPDGGCLPTEASGHTITPENPAHLCCAWQCAPCPAHGVWGHIPGPQSSGSSSPCCKPSLQRPWGFSECGCRESQRRALGVCQSCVLPPVIPCICFLELSKSQNDMTSDKQLLATGPRQCASRTERRSQSDTAINVTTRVFPKATRPPRELLLAHFSIDLVCLLS